MTHLIRFSGLIFFLLFGLAYLIILGPNAATDLLGFDAESLLEYKEHIEDHGVSSLQWLFLGLALAGGLAFIATWAKLKNQHTLSRLAFIFAVIAGLVGVYAWTGIGTEFDFDELFFKSHKFFRQLERMWPPDFGDLNLFTWPFQWGLLDQLWKPLLDTLRMSILGTFLGALLSLPLIMLSTRTVTREPWLYYPARFIMGILRSIPDLLYALLFVAAFGIGPVAGIPVLMVFSAGIIAKMTSESADNIDRGPIEAMEATGSGRLAIIGFAVIPQILPLFLSYSLYVFELNIRIAAILGYVGAGGIGQTLQTYMAFGFWDKVMTALILILIIVFVIDYISGRFRESLVEGKDLKLWWKGSLGFIVVAGIIWSAASIEIDFERITRGLEQLGRIMGSMMSPDWSVLGTGVEKMFESIQIAFLGTTISMFFAFPLGFFCAMNMGFPKWMVYAFRQIPNIIRTFPELILAILFIASYGPGAFPGVLALGIHSIGMLSRLNYEVVETIDRGPSEALNSIGAGRLINFRYAVLPQVIPEFIAIALYRFEINVRAASVLGIVGAGGIGTVIINATRLGRYHELGMLLLVVIVFVNSIDLASSWIRRKIIEG